MNLRFISYLKCTITNARGNLTSLLVFPSPTESGTEIISTRLEWITSFAGTTCTKQVWQYFRLLLLCIITWYDQNLDSASAVEKYIGSKSR